MEIETRLTVAQIAAAYGETASSIYAEVGRGTLQGIESDGRNPGRAGKPRPFAEALQMGLFVHMRRSLPSNGDLGRRCQAVAAAVTAWFWEAVTGKRPGLGFLVVSS